MRELSMHRSISFFICGFVFSVAQVGVAAESVDDLFGELDQSVKETKQEQATDRSILGDLWHSSEFTSVTRGGYFFKTPAQREGLDDNEYTLESRLEWATSFKRDWLIGNLEWWVEYGSQIDTYQGHTEIIDQDRFRNIVHLNELNFVITPIRWLDITLGKKVYEIGYAELYSPANQFVVKDLNDPVAPNKLGTWLTGLDVLLGQSTLSLYAFPGFTPDLVASDKSRWSGTGDNANSEFRGLGAGSTVEDDLPDIQWRNVSAMLKFESKLQGIDFFVTLAHRFTLGAVLFEQQVNQFLRRFTRVATASGGFSTTFKQFVVYGELIYQLPYGEEDDEYISYVAGFNYKASQWVKALGLDELEVVTEYAVEDIFELQIDESFERSSIDSRQFKDNIVNRIVATVNDNWKIVSLLNFDFDEGGEMYGGGIEYRWAGKFKLGANVEYFYGSEDSYFGQWRDNHRANITFEAKF